MPFRLLLTQRKIDRFAAAGFVFYPPPIVQPDVTDPAYGLVGRRFRVTMPVVGE